MDKRKEKMKDDTRKSEQIDKSSSSSDTDDEDRASGSNEKFKRLLNGKRRNYRRRNDNFHQNNYDNHSIDDEEEPSSSTATFHKLQKRVKRRNYRTTTADDDEASPSPLPEQNLPNPDADDSDASSPIDNDEERDENSPKGSDDSDDSDERTTTEEEKFVMPLVLRKIRPKSTLSIINEITGRQIGHGAQFERKFYGSLHMVERLKRLHELNEHQGCVNTVEFHSKGDLLVSGSDDLAVIIWNWATGKKYYSYESGHSDNIFQASWLPDDGELTMATCASDGQVRLLDLDNGTTRKLASHDGACNKFAIHSDFPHNVISVGDDGKVLSIDVRDAEISKLLTMKERAFAVKLYTIHWNPRNGNEFCVGGYSESVKVYDRRKTNTAISKLCPKNLVDNGRVHVTAVTYNHDGTEILASYNDDDIYLFDTLIPHPNGDYAHKYEGHRNRRTVKGVNYFGPKSEFIVSGSDCGNIYFWEKNTEAIVQCIPGDDEGVVNCVKPHPYIPVLASSGLDENVKIWVPSALEPRKMTNIRECVTANLKDRADGRRQCQNRYDVDSFCMILEHVCRYRELFSFLSDNRWGGTFNDDEDEDEDDDD